MDTSVVSEPVYDSATKMSGLTLAQVLMITPNTKRRERHIRNLQRSKKVRSYLTWRYQELKDLKSSVVLMMHSHVEPSHRNLLPNPVFRTRHQNPMHRKGSVFESKMRMIPRIPLQMSTTAREDVFQSESKAMVAPELRAGRRNRQVQARKSQKIKYAFSSISMRD